MATWSGSSGSRRKPLLAASLSARSISASNTVSGICGFSTDHPSVRDDRPEFAGSGGVSTRSVKR